MRKLILLFAMSVIIVGGINLIEKNKTTLQKPYTVHTVEMPPYSYEPYSDGVGVLLDVTIDAFKLANLPVEIEYHTTWDSAMNQVQLYRHAVFAADVKTNAREVTFKSVNTYLSIEFSAYTRVDNYWKYKDVKSLKGMRIGVVVDRLTGDREFDRAYMLDRYDFTSYKDTRHALAALYAGEIDVAILAKELAEYSLKNEFKTMQYKIEKRASLNTEYLHLLFNKNTPDAVINDLQVAFKQVSGKVRVYF